MSTLTAFAFIPNRSEATPALWNRIFSQLSDNLRSVAEGPFSGSTDTLSFSTNLEVTGGAHFQFLSVGSTPPSYVTTALITMAARSDQSDYLYLTDSSGLRSNYVIGSRAGGTADGLNIWDASGATMLASFSKQSIRFYQNVVGPVFDVGGALADTYNAATFGTGAQSVESRIQAAIDQASIDGISRVYVPANMYPYSASSVSFVHSVQMVREGGNWSVYDVKAYGAHGNGTHDDYSAISAAQSGSSVQGATVFFPAGNYSISTYIDVQSGTVWDGVGIPKIAGSTDGVTLQATGTNRGIIRWRPGLVGDPDPSPGVDLSVRGIGFSGTTLTGHLVHLARVGRIRFMECAFNNSQGTGLKDDNVTAVAAAGVYMYGVELASFIDCTWASETNANGGAAITAERSVHMVGIWNGQFNGNYHAIHFLDSDNGLWHIGGGSLLISNLSHAIKGTVGGWYSITLNSVWAETNGGSIVQSSGAGICRNLVVQGCTLASSGGQKAFDLGAIDNMVSQGNYFSTWSQIYSAAPGTSGISTNMEQANTYLTTTQVFAGNTASGNGFALSTTTASEIHALPMTGAGTALAPAFAFSSESSLGLYRSGTSHIGLSYGAMSLPAGTALFPSLAFSSETSLGLYRSATSTIAQSYGSTIFAPAPTQGDRVQIGTEPTAAFVTIASPSVATFTNILTDYMLLCRVSPVVANAFFISVATVTPTSFLGTNQNYDMAFVFGGTERARFRAIPGTLLLQAGLGHADGTALAPGSAFSSEMSLGFYRSGASTIRQSYGTLWVTGGELWAGSGLSVGNATAGGSLIPAISSTSSLVAAFVVQGSASSFTVITWAAVQPGDQILTTIKPDAAVSSLSSGLVLHSHATKAGQFEMRLSNVSTLAQNQSSKTYFFTRISPF